MIKLTQEEAIQRCKEAHGDRYDYSKTIFQSVRDKIEIICKEHGSFWQNFKVHTKGHGCSICGSILKIKKQRHLQLLIDKSNIIHNFLYDYSSIKNYKNNKIKVPIYCSVCKEIFYQSFNCHLTGCGCSKVHKINPLLLSQEESILKCKSAHGNKYDYSKTKYIRYNAKIEIICNEHGRFLQTYSTHVSQKCGCPICNSSHGEKIIFKFLKENNIDFITQKTFGNCKHKGILKFDFYIPSKNILIEYDGWQHFFVNEYFGGIEAFNDREIKDNIKNKYCEDNNIPLIRIPYWLLDDPKEIEEILLNDIK